MSVWTEVLRARRIGCGNAAIAKRMGNSIKSCSPDAPIMGTNLQSLVAISMPIHVDMQLNDNQILIGRLASGRCKHQAMTYHCGQFTIKIRLIGPAFCGYRRKASYR